MNEQDWLTITNPQRLLAHASGKTSVRKLRLLGAALCRRNFNAFGGPWLEAIEVAERFADGIAPPDEGHGPTAEIAMEVINGDVQMAVDSSDLEESEHEAAHAVACLTGDDLPNWIGPLAQSSLAALVAQDDEGEVATEVDPQEEEASQCELIRCVIPFRPVAVVPAWLTPAVLMLAAAAYEERMPYSGELDPVRIGVLADALEDAGAADMIAHLRAGRHVRGCHVIDTLLGRA